jgi:hypothetical protein
VTATVACLLAAGLLLGGLTAPGVLLIAVVLVQGALAGRWFAALAAPGGTAGTGLVLGAAVAADALVLTADDTRPMGEVPGVLALALLGSLGLQLVRRNGRAGVSGSLAATCTATVLAAAASVWLALDSVQGDLLVVAVIAAAAVPILDAGSPLVGARRWPAALAAVVAALGSGPVVAAVTELDALAALGGAAAAAVAARAGALLAGRVAAPTPVLTASLPLALAAPATYLVGRVVVG